MPAEIWWFTSLIGPGSGNAKKRVYPWATRSYTLMGTENRPPNVEPAYSPFLKHLPVGNKDDDDGRDYAKLVEGFNIRNAVQRLDGVHPDRSWSSCNKTSLSPISKFHFRQIHEIM